MGGGSRGGRGQGMVGAYRWRSTPRSTQMKSTWTKST